MRNGSPVEKGLVQIPLAAQLAGTVFAAVLVPVYLHT
jgi:hypothetical protein